VPFHKDDYLNMLRYIWIFFKTTLDHLEGFGLGLCFGIDFGKNRR